MPAHLTIEEPVFALVDTFAGTFRYIDPNGVGQVADLLIHCEPKPESDDPYHDEICARRVDALNLQFTQAWHGLEDKECTRIQFTDAKPDQFF